LRLVVTTTDEGVKISPRGIITDATADKIAASIEQAF